MASFLPGRPFGVYIHFPFCSHLCPYCDFAVTVRREPPHERYRDAVLAELGARQPEMRGAHLQSIYFGGGTPGLWRPDCLESLVVEIHKVWPSSSPVEITLEANPEHVTVSLLKQWKRLGINRLSLGVQSFNEVVLRQLGRTHSGVQAQEVVKQAHHEGFTHVSVDLIFAAPGQHREDFQRDLEIVGELPGLDHVSLYQLTIEPQTLFGREVRRGRMAEVDQELGADCFDDAESYLRAAGFHHYEVSNWARPGGESRHNRLYWTGAEYLGLGVGAHSLSLGEGQARRRANSRTLRVWQEDPAAGGGETEGVPERTFLGERLMTGLRTSSGVNLTELQATLDLDVDGEVGEVLRELVEEGLLIREGESIKVTQRGMRLGDLVAERVLA